MMDNKQKKEELLNHAIVFAEAYSTYLCKMKFHEKFRYIACEDHIYEFYKMMAYNMKGKAEGIRHVLWYVGYSSEKMRYLDMLLEV